MPSSTGFEVRLLVDLRRCPLTQQGLRLRIQVASEGEAPSLARYTAPQGVIVSAQADWLASARWEVTALRPGRRYTVVLEDQNQHAWASAVGQTLPDCLPETGLRIAASSCFAVDTPHRFDMADLWQTHAHLRPHLHLHLGDQVYLDCVGWLKTCFASGTQLGPHFAEIYSRTWHDPGFRRLLESTSSLFLADDHEVWNNYPHAHPMAWARGSAFWSDWQGAALDLCRAIQNPPEVWRRDLGEALSILAVDLRMGRSADGQTLAPAATLDALDTWVAGLGRRPGLLISSQPLFARPGLGIDRTLANYPEYLTRIVPALRAAKTDILVISGDCHYGRSCSTRLQPQLGPASPRLTEITTSPLALVSTIAGRRPDLQLTTFPGALGAPAQVEQSAIEHHEQMACRRHRWWAPKACAEHLITLDLHRRENEGIEVDLRRWPAPSGTPPKKTAAFLLRNAAELSSRR